MVKNKDKENLYMQIKIYMKDSGKKIIEKEKEKCYMQMEYYMMENG
jgi:hypothetical protein